MKVAQGCCRIAVLVSLFVWVVSLPISAQHVHRSPGVHGYSVGFDLDDSPATGCDMAVSDASYAGGPIPGIDLILLLEVDDTPSPPRVISASVQQCTGATFDPPTVIDATGWDVGSDVGVATAGGNADVIEGVLPAAYSQSSPTIGLVFASRSEGGGEDVVLAAGGPFVLAIQVPGIPTVGLWGAVLFMMLLTTGAFLLLRRSQPTMRAAVLALVIGGLGAGVAAAVVLDGQVGDWFGVAPLALDPQGDTTTSEDWVDIVAVFAAPAGLDVFVRFDVVELENQPPVARDDDVTTDEDSALIGADVLADNGNGVDSDLDGDPLTVTEVNGAGFTSGVAFALPSGALLTMSSNGTFDYDPNGQYEALGAGDSTTDAFTYTIDDGNGGTGTATVTVTITGVNDLPTITGIADQTIDEDTSTGPLPFTVADAETAATSLVVTASSSNQTLVPDANLTLGGTGGSRTIDVQPAADQSGGPVTITVTVDDGTATANTTFDVTVTPLNDPPTITAIADQTIDEDTTTGPLAFTIGDNETPVGALIVTASSSNQTLIPDANLTLAGVAPNLTIDVAPAANQFGGPATITVTVDDGTDTTGTTFDVTVTSVNDPPVGAADAFDTVGNTLLLVDVAATPGAPSINVGTTAGTTPAADGVLDNDSDPVEGSPVSVTGIVTDASQTSGVATAGTVTMYANGTFDYVPLPGDTDPTDAFDYLLSDGTDTVAVQVVITLVEEVWYVDNNGGGLDNGTSDDPFDTLAEAAAAAGAGGTIFVFTGDGSTTGQNAGITLADGQRLIGEGVDLTVDAALNGGSAPTTVYDSALNVAPFIGNAAGDGVTVLANTANGNRTGIEIRGLGVSGTDNAIDVSALNSQSVDIAITSNVLSSTGGASLSVDGSGTAGTLTVTELSADQVTGATAGGGLVFNGVTFDADLVTGGFQQVAAGAITVGNTGVPANVTGPGLRLNSVRGSLAVATLDIGNQNGTGLYIRDAAGKGGTFAFSVGGGTINTSGGTAIDIDPVNLGTSTLTSVTSTGPGGPGILLDTVTGSLDIGTTTVTDASGTGILVRNSGGAALDFGSTTVGDSSLGVAPVADGIDLATNNAGASFTFDTLSVTADGGRGLIASSSGTVNINSVLATVSAVGGAAVDIASTAGQTSGLSGWTFASLSSSSSSAEGIKLDGLTDAFTANGGAVTGATGTGFSLSGGAANVTYSGSITNTTGRAVDVTGRTGGAVTLQTGAVNDTGATGIRLANNNGGTVSLNGDVNVTNSTGAAVTLQTNGGVTFNFADLDVDNSTSNQIGLATSGSNIGATLNVTTGTVDGGTASAVDLDNIALGVTLVSADSDGGSAPGIDLRTTTGSFSVTGVGTTAASGGTIANKTGADGSSNGVGVYLDGVQNVSLANMQLNDFDNFAIRGNNVTGFTLASSTVNTVSGFNGTSAAADEGSISFDNLLGTASFTNSTISAGHEDNIVVTNTTGTLNRMTVTGCTIGLNNLNDGILAEAQGTAVLNLTVTGTAFQGSAGDHIQANVLDTAAMDVVIRDNTFQNAHPLSLGGGVTLSGGSATSNMTMTYDVSGTTAITPQTFRDSVSSAITVNPVNGAGTFTGTIRNNNIGVAGVAGSGSSGGGAGIAVATNASVVHNVTIDANNIRHIVGTSGGIDVAASGTGILNGTITNNTVSSLEGFTFAGLYTMSGGGAVTDTVTTCLDIRNNSFDASGSFGFDVFIDQLGGSTASYNFPGYVGPAAPGPSPNALDAFISGQNTLVQPFIDSSAAVNVTGTGTTCP